MWTNLMTPTKKNTSAVRCWSFFFIIRVHGSQRNPSPTGLSKLATQGLIFYFRACTFSVFHRYNQFHTRHWEDESLICILDFTYGDIIFLGYV